MNNISSRYCGMYTANRQHKIKFPKIDWIHFNREDNQILDNKDCVIIIPVYKTAKLSKYEILSIKQGIKILGNVYHICLVGPSSLDYSYYDSLFNFKFDILRCNDNFFKTISSYSCLCESAEFYKSFSDYHYMLIYQPDGFIFENKLNDFIQMNFDYIGSPWKAGEFKSSVESVGNGGVSLRKIETFIELCSLLSEKDMRASNWDYLEDLFFCKYVYKNIKQFNIAPANIARKFCISCYAKQFTANGKNMPMCAHTWSKDSEDLEFWKKYIIKENAN